MPAPLSNQLLQLLPRQDFAALAPDLERIVLQPATVLHDASAPPVYAYFPTGGMVALGALLEDGDEIGLGGIGRDGALFTDAEFRAPLRTATVLLPGAALRVPTRRWRDFLAERPRAAVLFARYHQLMLAEAQQHLACQSRHDIESRFCQCLLQMHSWQDGKALPLTHATLARFLGVRRTTITLIAKSLQNAGIIRYSRGVVEVADLHALHQSSCECFRTLAGYRAEFRSQLADGSETASPPLAPTTRAPAAVLPSVARPD